MAETEITVAAIGLGRRVASVLTNLCAVAPRVRIVGVCDPEPVGLPQLEAAAVAPGQRFTNPEAMLESLSPSPDWVFVGSPNHLHLAHIRIALEAGCRVFSEKPVVRTEEETWALCELLGRYGESRLLVGLVLRSAPLVVAIQRLLAEGRVGRIVSAEANEHLHPEHGGFLARDWRRRSEWTGSFLLDKCCHDFDLYRLFVGSVPTRVASFGGRGIFNEASAELGERRHPNGYPAYHVWPMGWEAADDPFVADGDVSDHQVALVEYANGVRLSFHASSHSSVLQRRWLLVGTRGTLDADLVANHLVLRDAIANDEPLRESFEPDVIGHAGADRSMARDLAAHMVDGEPFPVRPYDAMVAGLTVMAVDRAARTGEVVDCSETWKKLDALYPGPCG